MIKSCIGGVYRSKKTTSGKSAVKNQLKKALIVGINYTGTSNQLNGCINDANKMKSYLLEQCGFDEKNIVMLSDHIGGTKLQLPTRSNIINNILALTRNIPASVDCQLVFHYSGHGSYTYDRTGKEEIDGRDETICPIDYDVSGDITDDDLKTLLVDSLPSNAKLFCVLDCCHSGTVLDLKYDCKIIKSGLQTEYRVIENGYENVSKGEVILISGCKDEQTSADAYINRKYQGALTWALFATLEKHNYQPLAYKDLLFEIQNLLKTNKYEQVPQLSSGQFIDLKQNFCLTD